MSPDSLLRLCSYVNLLLTYLLTYIRTCTTETRQNVEYINFQSLFCKKCTKALSLTSTTGPAPGPRWGAASNPFVPICEILDPPLALKMQLKLSLPDLLHCPCAGDTTLPQLTPRAKGYWGLRLPGSRADLCYGMGSPPLRAAEAKAFLSTDTQILMF